MVKNKIGGGGAWLMWVLVGVFFAQTHLVGAVGKDVEVGVTVCDTLGNCPTPTPTASPTPTPTLIPTPPSSGSTTGTSGDSSNMAAAGTLACQHSAPQSAPYLNSATRITESAIRLQFTPAGNPLTHYALFYGFAPDNFIYGITFDAPADRNSFVVNNLAAGVTYYFQLLPMNDCAGGQASNTFPVTLAKAGTQVALFPDRDEPLAVGETVTAPDVVLPLEQDEAGAEVDSGVAAGTFPGEPVVSLPLPVAGGSTSILGLFFTAGEACYFQGGWRWLCWPWWLLILLLIVGGVVIWRYRRQQPPARGRGRGRRQN